MPSVLKINVRAQLILTILLTIFLTWVLSSASAYYFYLQNLHAIHDYMQAHPERYPAPIPAPRFDVIEMLFGQQHPGPLPPNPALGLDQPAIGSPPQAGPDDGNPPPDDVQPPPRVPGVAPPGNGPRRPPRRPLPPGSMRFNWVAALSRLAVAVLLGLVAGTWLHRRFSRPLGELTKGARAFHGGNLAYRIPVSGEDEFTGVATAMNEMAARVSRQLNDLEVDARRRQQLLADVAHELRSPVTTLLTMSGALQEGLAEDPERRQRALRAMAGTSERLLHLVSDLLVLARLDLRELPLHCQPVDVRELAAVCVQAKIPAATQAGIGLTPVEDGPPVIVSADPDRLAQAIDNLLDNAITYAGEGARVGVSFTGEDPLSMSISDTGRGIPAAHLPHIFEPFYRADQARTPGGSHSGLGLRIARGLVEAHGGTLTLESEVGQGTRAIITLPRKSGKETGQE